MVQKPLRIPVFCHVGSKTVLQVLEQLSDAGAVNVYVPHRDVPGKKVRRGRGDPMRGCDGGRYLYHGEWTAARTPVEKPRLAKSMFWDRSAERSGLAEFRRGGKGSTRGCSVRERAYVSCTAPTIDGRRMASGQPVVKGPHGQSARWKGIGAWVGLSTLFPSRTHGLDEPRYVHST